MTDVTLSRQTVTKITKRPLDVHQVFEANLTQNRPVTVYKRKEGDIYVSQNTLADMRRSHTDLTVNKIRAGPDIYSADISVADAARVHALEARVQALEALVTALGATPT